MVINDFILKNELLSSQMKAYLQEIEKLDRLRDLIREKSSPKNEYAHLLSVRLKPIIDSAKSDFEWINDTYDQKTHDLKETRANGGKGFVQAAKYGSEHLQKIFLDIKNKKQKIHKTVSEYCHLVDMEFNN